MDADTQIGGANAGFPDTRHSALAAIHSEDSDRRTIAYDAIVSAYWKPVYRYIRLKWRTPNEDAKDLTQTFFALVLEKQYLVGFCPEKGTFRTYLRTCLDCFLANEHKFRTRLKRGAELVPLEAEAAVTESPESLFKREWERGMFESAVERLREKLHARGHAIWFAVFERYDLAEEHATYAEIAHEFGISAAAVTNHLAASRRELRRIVLDQVRSITADEHEFQREARALLR